MIVVVEAVALVSLLDDDDEVFPSLAQTGVAMHASTYCRSQES